VTLTPFKMGHGVENLRVSPVTKSTSCAAAGKAPDILRADYHVLTAWLLLPLCLRATIDDRKFDMQAPSLAAGTELLQAPLHARGTTKRPKDLHHRSKSIGIVVKRGRRAPVKPFRRVLTVRGRQGRRTGNGPGAPPRLERWTHADRWPEPIPPTSGQGDGIEI
jgi:hypothetical protein